MSWLDRVLAVPVIGIRFRPWFKTASDYARALEAFFEDLEPDGAADVQAQVADLEFRDRKGLRGTVSSTELILRFAYRPEMTEKPGQVPQLHYPAPIERFTTVLQTVERAFGSTAKALITQRRPVARIGIVAEARLERHALPPGAERFLSHLSRPWGEGLQEGKVSLSAVLQKGEGWVQRCHHKLEFSDAPASGDPTGILALGLDWQQVYQPMQAMTADELIRATAACREAALLYFEKFGRGDLGYVA
jgi:hypothetical protein